MKKDLDLSCSTITGSEEVFVRTVTNDYNDADEDVRGPSKKFIAAYEDDY